MRLNRRAFLQQATLALGALGMGSTALLGTAGPYHQALAKPARRKLALLIGINAYPDRALDPDIAQDVALKGCLSDVDLQRQLLVHRFGFDPADVLTLTNQEATRSGILTAIEEHLVQQARADDVVLLHFSGYGSQVRVQGSDGATALTTAWVPVDSRLPNETSPALADLLEAEVVNRLNRLATLNLTTVIDAGSQDAGYLRWGNSRVRSRPTVPTGVISLGALPHPDGTALPFNAPWPGLLLRAADSGHLVLESQWDGFSAGVFTYALTQSLWEAEPSSEPGVLMQRTGRYLQRWVGADQQPVVADRLAPRSAPAYGLPPVLSTAAGVVLPSSGDRSLSLWLGGMPPQVLRYLQPDSRLVAGPHPGRPLRLESRNGLRGLAKPLDDTALAPLANQPIYEQVRVLPQPIDLVVALDSQLRRVERVDATSALAGIPLVTAIVAGERAADCLFGRLPIGPAPTLTAALPGVATAGPKPNSNRPSESSYGLFAPNRTLMPGTMLAREEAVKTSVNRLTPYLQTLLALKLVRLTENQTSSQLAVAAALEALQPKPGPLWVKTTGRSAPPVWPLAIRQAQKTLGPGEPLTLTRDSRVSYRLANGSDQALHLLWISFNSRGECTALMPLPEVEADDSELADRPLGAAPLAPGEVLTFPNDGAGWAMPRLATWAEAHIVLSTQPLDRCLTVLSRTPPSLATGFRPVREPLQLAQALLQDLSAGSAEGAIDDYVLHHDRWATLSLRYEVV